MDDLVACDCSTLYAFMRVCVCLDQHVGTRRVGQRRGQLWHPDGRGDECQECHSALVTATKNIWSCDVNVMTGAASHHGNQARDIKGVEV